MRFENVNHGLYSGRGGRGPGHVEEDIGLLQGEQRGLHRRLLPSVAQVALLQHRGSLKSHRVALAEAAPDILRKQGPLDRVPHPFSV